jgi:hypothetical protein
MIITPFPPPPEFVTHALDQLRAMHAGQRVARGAARDLARPWEPATCSEQMRAAVWWWCDDVAAWLNHEYAWRPMQLIPACWTQHPHLAHELPVLACLRVEAEAATAPELLESWHREALPHFVDRMIARLGESGCRTGTHTDWPAAARHDAYHSEQAVADRQSRIYDDTYPPESDTSIPD